MAGYDDATKRQTTWRGELHEAMLYTFSLLLLKILVKAVTCRVILLGSFLAPNLTPPRHVSVVSHNGPWPVNTAMDRCTRGQHHGARGIPLAAGQGVVRGMG